jgi:aminoglycoside 2'-N-acetyltransferase I
MDKSIFVTSFRTEDMDISLRVQITNLCVAAHQEEDFRNLFSYVPSGGWHFLAYQGDQLISHAMATTRWLQPEGHPLLKTAYIDAVSTLPDYQGRGYGSAVMRRLAVEIDDEYVIACLETDREAFYARLGWESWRGPLAGRGDQGLVLTPEQQGIMILRLSQTPPLEFESLLTIECQTGRIW